jgi:hypothetical protein
VGGAAVSRRTPTRMSSAARAIRPVPLASSSFIRPSLALLGGLLELIELLLHLADESSRGAPPLDRFLQFALDSPGRTTLDGRVPGLQDVGLGSPGVIGGIQSSCCERGQNRWLADSIGRRNSLISEVCDVATADWNVKTSDVPEGRRRQWRADRALRPAMRSPGRPDPSRVVQRQFWRLIATGVTTAEASLAVGVSWPVGARWFRHAGGMPPISLAEPSGRYLTFEEREEIAILRAMDKGVREIARALGRDPGTISRELRRNAATRSGKQIYRATVAQWKAQQAAKRPRSAKLLGNDRLREYMQERLSGSVRRADGTVVAGPRTPAWKGLNKPHRQDRRWSTAWSPEQSSHRLRIDFPEDESMRISHEAIHQALFIEGRGALKRELVTCLRTGRALRVPRARSQNKPQGHVTADVRQTGTSSG